MEPTGMSANWKTLKRCVHTPYSKMAENTLFFGLQINRPLLPHFKPIIPLNSADGIEATRATELTIRQKVMYSPF